MSTYQTFGPFKMPKKGSRVDGRACGDFWAGVEQHDPGLARAVGCYVFAISAAKGALPWYVGKTEKHGFKGETWSPHKLNLYSEALDSRERGAAVLYLIAKRTTTGRFAKPRKRGIGDVSALENLLMITCLLRNPKLLNVKQMRHPRGIVVPGYMNERPGARSAPAKSLAKLLHT